MGWKQRWIKAELAGILILCLGKMYDAGRESSQGVEWSLEQYRDLGKYWSQGIHTETGENDALELLVGKGTGTPEETSGDISAGLSERARNETSGETTKLRQVSGAEAAEDQTGGTSGNQAESGGRFRTQTENPIEEKPKIALTFDDGPNPNYTPMLLDGLKERNVKATFFLIGESAKEYPKIVERIQVEGHLIGNHTYHHCELTALSPAKGLEEIEQTSRVIEAIIGRPVQYVRPPYGEWPEVLEEKVSMIPVLWTVDSLDWTTENVEEIVNRVVTKVGENDMILMHDCYESSVKAAFQIIDLLQEKGYRFVLAEELLL